MHQHLIIELVLALALEIIDAGKGSKMSTNVKYLSKVNTRFGSGSIAD